jgi:hypothetical protein
MKIAINHLTRMQAGFMCVAGIDLATGLHVRPVLDRQMKIDMLSVHGGLFDIGRIVDLGETRFVGRLPEVEDHRFEAAAARNAGEMPGAEFWGLLQRIAHEKLSLVFGPDLERFGATCAVAASCGLRSLGCYWATGAKLFIDAGRERRRVRFAWPAGGHAFNVPVTDIRLYGSDHVTPCEATISRIAAQIAARPRALVSVGLSRPFRKTTDDPPRHWLQINNVHLEDSPCWTLESCRPPGQA